MILLIRRFFCFFVYGLRGFSQRDSLHSSFFYPADYADFRRGIRCTHPFLSRRLRRFSQKALLRLAFFSSTDYADFRRGIRCTHPFLSRRLRRFSLKASLYSSFFYLPRITRIFAEGFALLMLFLSRRLRRFSQKALLRLAFFSSTDYADFRRGIRFAHALFIPQITQIFAEGFVAFSFFFFHGLRGFSLRDSLHSSFFYPADYADFR